MGVSSRGPLGTETTLVSTLIGLAWILVYIVLITPVFIFSALGGQWLGRVVWPGASPIFHGIAWMAGVFLITWLIRVKANRRAWSSLGLPRAQLLRLALGGLTGVSLILLVSLIEYQMGWLHVVGVNTGLHHGVSKPLWMVLALVPSLAVGFSEELAFRGYVFQTLAERVPVWLAAILMSVVFALAHFSLRGFDVGFVVSVTVMSLLFLSLRFAFGSLWFAIGFHGAWDWTQTYLVGLATTGTGNDPALVQITQSGPALWVGNQQATEAGLLFLLIATSVLIVALTYAAAVGRSPSWTQPLRAET
ncbi:MAG TPA: type II CAAX endopeptidase family protein [Gemmatimonadaceae bacterium]|nr:type II CAAX endopeptidase family protein [Gemmatimonadaceae bacterium]